MKMCQTNFMLLIISVKERKENIYAYNIKGVKICRYKKSIISYDTFNPEENKKENRQKRARIEDESNQKVAD